MGSVDEPRQFNVKSVAVIGAGPCGLAAAKYLLAEANFEGIVVFEQQAEVGGVWNYCEEPSATLHVPQVNHSCPPDPPLRGPDGQAPKFPSPMYDLLHTNIPWPLMKFGDLDFPAGSLIFPPREAVQDYLVAYSRDVRHLIKFSTQVESVELRQESGRDKWDVTATSTASRERSSRSFDAIVVASGHYATTFIPEVKNIKEFHQRFPGVISHSKLYRSPRAYAGKKVVVVGNAASGIDIATQISRFSQSPLLLSVQTPTPPENLAHSRAEEVPPIEEFLLEERAVKFRGGRIERDIDAVIFCTGYLFALPFLKSLEPPLITNGKRIHGLYEDLFHIEHPTLVFPGLPIKVVPFPLSEGQAAVFARVWANRLELPSTDEMRQWEKSEEQKREKSFHVFPKGGDVDYIKKMHDWAVQAGSHGKEPPVWDEVQVWQRQVYFEAKLKFEVEGRTAKSLQELGFYYEPPSEVEIPKETL